MFNCCKNRAINQNIAGSWHEQVPTSYIHSSKSSRYNDCNRSVAIIRAAALLLMCSGTPAHFPQQADRRRGVREQGFKKRPLADAFSAEQQQGGVRRSNGARHLSTTWHRTHRSLSDKVHRRAACITQGQHG
eukprot:5136043-Amphidinium_carterae.1